jgi:RND family efflux transporter MFP subunit
LEEGEVLTASSPVVTIAEEGGLEIESNVPESDIIKVALDQNVDVTLDAFTIQDIFNAKISEIEPAATVIQDVVYYKVKMKLENPDGRFRNGMSVDGDIHTDEKSDAVIIPLRAVKSENSEKYVEVLGGDGISTEKIKVTTGLEGDEGMVEIRSGLKGGEKVITFIKTE